MSLMFDTLGSATFARFDRPMTTHFRPRRSRLEGALFICLVISAVAGISWLTPFVVAAGWAGHRDAKSEIEESVAIQRRAYSESLMRCRFKVKKGRAASSPALADLRRRWTRRLILPVGVACLTAALAIMGTNGMPLESHLAGLKFPVVAVMTAAVFCIIVYGGNLAFFKDEP